MTLLDVKEGPKSGQYTEYWKDDDFNLVKRVIDSDGETVSEEDMCECACRGCWENR